MSDHYSIIRVSLTVPSLLIFTVLTSCGIKFSSKLLLIALIFTGTMKIERVSAAGSETIKFSVRYGQTDARKMADKLNVFRAENGKSALTYDYNLEKVAMQRAAEIAVRFKTDDKETNIRPDGQTYKQTLADFGFDIS